MPRIEREAIGTDVRKVAVPLKALLPAAVARDAQALQRVEPKFVDVAMMRLDVIGDASGGHPTFAQTPRTQRLDPELMSGHPFPTLGVVKAHWLSRPCHRTR